MYLGIADFWVFLAYVLCGFFALLCVVYGTLMWNKGEEAVLPEDVVWAKQEDEISKDL